MGPLWSAMLQGGLLVDWLVSKEKFNYVIVSIYFLLSLL